MGDRQRYKGALIPALRRVDGVRFVLGGDRLYAEVYGISHRRPATIPVSVSLAARLVAAGAPLSVRTERPTARPVKVA
jgi:hypothetical protein